MPGAFSTNNLEQRRTLSPRVKMGQRVGLESNFSLFRFLISMFIGYYFASNLRTRCSITSRYSRVEESCETISEIKNISQRQSRSEYQHKKSILIGVMTTERNLNSRAKAMYDTWARMIPSSRIIFFVGRNSAYNGTLPIIVLDNVVDEDYPPQRKSFRMLQYMYNEFIDQFHFFVRADDDVYIKGRKLVLFLNSVNSSLPYYIGQSGDGVEEERGSLGLSGFRTYCIGGPGVILSRQALKRIGPHINTCMYNVASAHEDTEVGRCVQAYAGIKCTQAYEWARLMYHNFREKKGSFTHDLGPTELGALTLHPVKMAPYVYRLHTFIMLDEIEEMRLRVKLLRVEIETMRTRQGVSRDDSIVDIQKYDETFKWYAYDSIFYRDETEDTKSPKRTRVNEKQLTKAIMPILFRFRKINSHLDMKMYGRIAAYQQVIPNKGVDNSFIYRVSYVKDKRRKRLTVPFRLHQPFVNIEISKNEFFGQHGPSVNLIMSLSGRHDMLTLFMDNYIRIANSLQMPVTLTVMLYNGNDDDFKKNHDLLKESVKAHPHARISVVNKQRDKFSRGIALHEATSRFINESLLLFIDVDTKFTTDFLKRIQRNTIRGYRVVFPVYFTLYDPEFVCGLPKCDLPSNDFGSDTGIWRPFGYGMVGIYKSDYVRCGGFDTTIIGWGGEDVDLHTKVMRVGLDTMRSADPGLIHVYHKKQCTYDLPPKRYQSCMNSMAYLWGSQKQLALRVRQL